MTILLTIVASLAGAWILLNVAGFIYVRGRFRDPWNWRILLGPDVYYRWLERGDP